MEVFKNEGQEERGRGDFQESEDVHVDVVNFYHYLESIL